GVVGAPELEGAAALEVLALEEDARPGERVERPRREDRCAVGDAGEADGRRLDVGKRGDGQNANWMPPRSSMGTTDHRRFRERFMSAAMKTPTGRTEKRWPSPKRKP